MLYNFRFHPPKIFSFIFSLDFIFYYARNNSVGVFIIVAGVIASTTIRLQTITLYEWVLMLVLIFGGVGLLAKILIANPEEDYGYHSRKRNRKGSYSDDIDRQLEDMRRGRK